ncbi:MAG: hypothetical protein GIW99_11025 [Candidatus Eremiobacteraeota bacterium]|nr:hypothetical protein [Candidatus Eremiobacteraeota bacterium]MBC5828192.1 hypothetical protein [Candidatus Eremiobacteraeota bacterium]
MMQPGAVQAMRLLENRSQAAAVRASRTVENNRLLHRRLVGDAVAAATYVKSLPAWSRFLCAAFQMRLERSAFEAAAALASMNRARIVQESAAATALRWSRLRRGLERRYSRRALKPRL